ncbi:MAG: hypothetical protein ABIP21_10845 [Acidimicrobiia bacterium]
MMRTPARAALVTVLVAVSLTACGSDTGVSKTASSRLHAEITLLRAASTSGDRASARIALARVRAEIAQLRSRGELSADAVRRLRAATAAVEQQLSLLPEPTTTTTTTTAPPSEGKGREKSGDEHGKDAKEKD